MQWTKWIGACLVLTAVLTFGCKKKNDSAGDAGATETSSHEGDGEGHSHGDADEHADHGDQTADTSTGKEESSQAKIAANFAKLSDADRALAEKQKICPVSGETLGEMGAPIKIHVKDQDVFLCCKACEKSVKEDPDKYLAKLKQ